jgi:hypothetical protein
MTTHRPQDDLPPVYYKNLSKIIYQVGPLTDDDDARALYGYRSGGKFENFKQFYEQVSQLQAYNYKAPNRSVSVLEIKRLNY